MSADRGTTCRKCSHFRSEVQKRGDIVKVVNHCTLSGKVILAIMCPCPLYQPITTDREEVNPHAKA